MNDFYQSKESVHNSHDIGSQVPKIRKTSLIKAIQKPYKEYNIETDLKVDRKHLPSNHLMNKIGFYKQRVKVYKFLERPDSYIAVGYHISILLVIFICLVMTVLSTISVYAKEASIGLKLIDCFVVVVFGTEFILRLWSSSCVSHYRGWRGKFRFFRSPFRIIDIFIIMTSIIFLLYDVKSEFLSTSLKGGRIVQVFQILRLEHRFSPWRMMASVVWAQREHLCITTYVGLLALLFISFIVYFIEKDSNPAFNSLASSLWWGVITLCTIGYGDIYPITPIGKLLTCVCSIIGVSIFALPAGILGTGLALKVQEQQRQRHLSKRQTPAAQLIQSVWRCYSANKQSNASNIWKTHLNSKTKIRKFNNQEMNAIKFILLVKYLIARRNFSKSFKPYDIKDVLEQYAAGHTDVLARVKHMYIRLNFIQAIANTGLKTQQESKYILTTRLTQVEQLLIELQMKLNALVEKQLENNIMFNKVIDLLSLDNRFKIEAQSTSESLHSRKSYKRRRISL